MKLSQRLEGIIRERHLLGHPFYQAWTEGRLDLDILRRYAGQYFTHVAAFPRYVSAVHSRCPDIEARKVLLQNLVEEEIKGTDHPELWLRFAEGIGASRDAVAAEEPLPETRALVDRFFELTSGPWTAGLAALFTYEWQVPEVATSKIDGLKRFYGVEDARTLSFFEVHRHYDVEHSAQIAALIDRHADPDTAEPAARAAADALWGFLDGIAREARISAC